MSSFRGTALLLAVFTLSRRACSTFPRDLTFHRRAGTVANVSGFRPREYTVWSTPM